MIITFLDDALWVGVDIHELEMTIEVTFTHLKEKKEKGVANFYWSTNRGTRRSFWGCRLCFALPNEYLRNYFCRIVTTIKLEANIEDEESWVLQGSTTNNFSATVDSLRVYVSKDFKGLYIWLQYLSSELHRSLSSICFGFRNQSFGFGLYDRLAGLGQLIVSDVHISVL